MCLKFIPVVVVICDLFLALAYCRCTSLLIHSLVEEQKCLAALTKLYPIEYFISCLLVLRSYRIGQHISNVLALLRTLSLPRLNKSQKGRVGVCQTSRFKYLAIIQSLQGSI